jgi:DNA-binding NtrC family response regulator
MRARHRPTAVTIVADNPETLDELQQYLRRAGITTNGTRQIERSADMTPPSTTAVVMFPDDFHSGDVMAALAALRSRRPKALTVVVTREPARFDTLPSSDGSQSVLVVPKPAWGWTILDAIRGRLDDQAPKSGERIT